MKKMKKKKKMKIRGSCKTLRKIGEWVPSKSLLFIGQGSYMPYTYWDKLRKEKDKEQPKPLELPLEMPLPEPEENKEKEKKDGERGIWEIEI